MENKDNLFNKIKSAAENVENKDFSSMEKVWSRIDAKLDTKVEKNNNNWKKLFIAASVIFIGTIVFQLIKNNEPKRPNKIVVTNDSLHQNFPKIIDNKKAIVIVDTISNLNIKKEVNTILEKQIKSQNSLAVEEVSNPQNNEVVYSIKVDDINKTNHKNIDSKINEDEPGNWLGIRNFESRGVVYQDVAIDKESVQKEKTVETPKKQDPLVVINGKVSAKTKDQLNKTELDSVIELKEPIYYINKVLYTEEELFGPNPSSPYAPLNKQDIETISILQPEKAKAIYGKKGEKGVVIITTKNGKPKPKKQ